MTNNQHTPGPWVLTKNPSRLEVRTDRMHSYAFSHRDEANASLIAAAPDLLAALELIYSNAAESPEWIRERIGPAIAKARGLS